MTLEHMVDRDHNWIGQLASVKNLGGGIKGNMRAIYMGIGEVNGSISTEVDFRVRMFVWLGFYLPSNLPNACHTQCELLARRYLFRVFIIPRENRPVNQAMLSLVCIKNREISFSQGLLGGCYRGIVKDKS